MKYEYRISESRLSDEDGVEHTVFGIEAWSNNCLTRVVSDVFCDRARAEYYVGRFNELGLSLIHLDDVIDDII